MRSDEMKRGIERAPHRALLKALGLTDKDIAKPFIGVANSFTTIVPGHIHLKNIAESVKAGILAAGGTPKCQPSPTQQCSLGEGWHFGGWRNAFRV